MKKAITILITLFVFNTKAQNPGLIISEVFANPLGTDSCKEYVELIASQNINFSLTPYTIIVTNNGAASSSGWVAGGSITYAFGINSGSVGIGQVVYVGGNCMIPNVNLIRTINVKYVNGDGGIGLPNASGVFGNGGSNADAVAVFKLPVAAINSLTVPSDVLFFGTGIGTASVSPGNIGYQLPISDLYSGGCLTGNSFFGPDPGSDVLITTSGLFNLANNTWSISRTVSSGTVQTVAVSSVSLITSGMVSPASISFLSNDTTVNESVSSANIFMRLTSTSTMSSSISVYASVISNASASDYTLANITVTFAPNAPINSSVPITINLNNDLLAESAEYIILRLYDPQNCNLGSITQFAFYISDNDKVIPQASNTLSLNLLSSFSNTVSGSNSAEIVAHDPVTQRLFIANSIAGKLDIVNFINPSSPTLLLSVPITTYGNINSIAVKNGIVAAAIENGINPQDSGKVVFFNTNGVYLNQVKVGMMPDMITFNRAGTKVLTANEGEPNAAYTLDPDGSVSIINIAGGIANLNQSNVSHITFTAYNGQETSLRAQGIRIYGLNASASKDFEPEYICVSEDDSKAWVGLQENNAMVEINLQNNTITSIKSLGTKNYSLLNNGIDASNVTRGVNISNFPIKGFYLPDAIATYTVGGVDYIISANEGDSRDYSGFTEESRIALLNLDPQKFPNGNELKNNYVLGRLLSTNKNGDIDNDGDIDTIYTYGSRSFSIWNGSTGNLVYDSKDDLEMITATNSYSVLFNASNSNSTRKDRSDDKGPEPEGVAIGKIGLNTYAFIAIERIGGVMVYDVSNPLTPVFVTYVNNRYLPANGPDLGAEGIIFIPQSQSPNGQNIVIAANEISSTLSIWGIPGCLAPISSSISAVGQSSNNCSNNAPILSVINSASLTYQWSNNGNLISGANSHSIIAINSGNYSVAIIGGTNCATGSILQTLTVNPSPTITISGANNICLGSSLSQTLSGAVSYSNNGLPTNSLVSFSPISSGNYSIVGISSNSCISTLNVSYTVNSNPTITVNSGSICAGNNFTINPNGANTYTIQGGTAVVSPLSNSSYTVIGTNTITGCRSQTFATSNLIVNASPTITVNSGVICAGENFSINPSGANTYTIQGGNSVVSPSITASYTVAGTSTAGCVSQIFATSNITVNACTSISQITNSGNEFIVYPNPFNNKITIISSSSNQSVQVFNAIGSLVYYSRIENEKIEIDLNQQAKGIYFVRIGLITKKLIKE